MYDEKLTEEYIYFKKNVNYGMCITVHVFFLFWSGKVINIVIIVFSFIILRDYI